MPLEEGISREDRGRRDQPQSRKHRKAVYRPEMLDGGPLQAPQEVNGVLVNKYGDEHHRQIKDTSHQGMEVEDCTSGIRHLRAGRPSGNPQPIPGGLESTRLRSYRCGDRRVNCGHAIAHQDSSWREVRHK